MALGIVSIDGTLGGTSAVLAVCRRQQPVYRDHLSLRRRRSGAGRRCRRLHRQDPETQATPPHLHFEIIVNDTEINPYPALRDNGCSAGSTSQQQVGGASVGCSTAWCFVVGGLNVISIPISTRFLLGVVGQEVCEIVEWRRLAPRFAPRRRYAIARSEQRAEWFRFSGRHRSVRPHGIGRRRRRPLHPVGLLVLDEHDRTGDGCDDMTVALCLDVHVEQRGEFFRGVTPQPSRPQRSSRSDPRHGRTAGRELGFRPPGTRHQAAGHSRNPVMGTATAPSRRPLQAAWPKRRASALLSSVDFVFESGDLGQDRGSLVFEAFEPELLRRCSASARWFRWCRDGPAASSKSLFARIAQQLGSGAGFDLAGHRSTNIRNRTYVRKRLLVMSRCGVSRSLNRSSAIAPLRTTGPCVKILRSSHRGRRRPGCPPSGCRCRLVAPALIRRGRAGTAGPRSRIGVAYAATRYTQRLSPMTRIEQFRGGIAR